MSASSLLTEISQRKIRKLENKSQETVEVSNLTPNELLFIRNCTACQFSVPTYSRMAKLVVEGCRDCTIILHFSSIMTNVVEVINSTSCTIYFDNTNVKTIQCDNVATSSLQFGAAADLGNIQVLWSSSCANNTIRTNYEQGKSQGNETAVTLAKKEGQAEDTQYRSHFSASGSLLTEVIQSHHAAPPPPPPIVQAKSIAPSPSLVAPPKPPSAPKAPLFTAPPPPPPQMVSSVAAAPPPPPGAMPPISKKPAKKWATVETSSASNLPTLNEVYIVKDSEVVDHPHTNIKIMVMQAYNIANQNICAKFIDEKLQQEIDTSGRKPDIILLPEHWLSMLIRTDLIDKTFQPISEVIAKYQVYALIGFVENAFQEKKRFNACVFLGRNGKVLAKYRKRKPVAIENSDPGDKPCIVDTQFGRIALVICFDIENQDILDENMLYKPNIILNPVYISAISERNSQPQAIANSWRTGLEMMARNYEYIALQNNIVIVRCDQPFNSSKKSFVAGTSQAIFPDKTIHATTNDECCFSVYIEKKSLTTFSNHTNPSSYVRTSEKDNNGNRVIVQTFQHAQNHPITAFDVNTDPLIVAGDDKGKVAVYSALNRSCQSSWQAHAATVTAVTRINKQLFASSSGKEIKIWDITKFTLEKSIDTTEDVTSLTTVVVNGEECLVAASSSGNVWLFSQYSETASVHAHSAAVKKCIVVRDTIVSYSKDKVSIHQVRDQKTLELVHSMELVDISEVHILRSNLYIVHHGVQQVQVFDLEKNTATLAFSLSCAPVHQFIPVTNKHAFILNSNRLLQLIDFEENKILGSFIEGSEPSATQRLVYDGKHRVFAIQANSLIKLNEFTSNRVPADFYTLIKQ